jgi:DNA-binding MarR family transcriptional regulator
MYLLRWYGAAVTSGELYRLARFLREVALSVTTDPGEGRPSLALMAITEDIAHHGETTIGEVAGRTALAQSLVSKTVAELRDAGVLATRADDSDRRRTRISISDAARSELFATRAARGVTAALQERLPHLPPERIAAVETLLDHLAAELRPGG